MNSLSLDLNALLLAIAIVETNATPTKIGDGGRAISEYQIHEAAWLDAHDYIARHPGQFPIDGDGVDWSDIGPNWRDIGYPTRLSRVRAKNCARAYLLRIADHLERHGVPVTPEHLYAAYNVGFVAYHDNYNNNYRSAGYPADRLRAIHRISELLKNETVHHD